MFANHGRIEKYNHEFEDVNSRLDGLEAAIFDAKLKHLEKWTERRRTIASQYDEALKGMVVTPKVMPDVRHLYHLYVIRLKNRDALSKALAEQGISTCIHYPIPLPFLKAYAYLGHKPEDYPVAFLLKDEIFSVPIHGSMQDEEVEFVIETTKNSIKR